jgi:hypothetical protein
MNSNEKTMPLCVVSVENLLKTQFPARKTLLNPWLQSQNLSMLYSWRGVGKTHAALNIAYAVASGGRWLEWEAPEPAPVLYLDGEMPAIALQERLNAIIAGSDKELPIDYLRVMTPDMNQDRFLPDLSTYEGQLEINSIVGNAELIIVDNLSCLASRGGKENEAESWQIVADWGLQQRAQGRAVLFIHHAGKGGQQRGTSKREDILDNVISLKHPKNYEPQEGARFEIHFEKSRALYGTSIIPIEATLNVDPHGKQAWTTSKAVNVLTNQIHELRDKGLSQRRIATELGIGSGTVNRHIKKADI